jgi:uncharacterized repeat protein (TIGR03987 family)
MLILHFGIVFIISAFILYTLAIWRERCLKELRAWIIIVFGTGLVCDFIGTSIMFLIADVKFSLSFHSLAGYSALIIMLLHFCWALFAFKIPLFAKYFTKYSIVAWFIWIIAFISGMPKG